MAWPARLSPLAVAVNVPWYILRIAPVVLKAVVAVSWILTAASLLLAGAAPMPMGSAICPVKVAVPDTFNAPVMTVSPAAMAEGDGSLEVCAHAPTVEPRSSPTRSPIRARRMTSPHSVVTDRGRGIGSLSDHPEGPE